MYVIPLSKYPANPPSIGNPDTIKQRSALYLTMVVGSIAVLFLAVWLGRRLQPRFGNWNATLSRALVVVHDDRPHDPLPPFGHLAANHGSASATETPLPLRNATGQSSTPASRPTCCSTSASPRSPHSPAVGSHRPGFAPLAERLLRTEMSNEHVSARVG